MVEPTAFFEVEFSTSFRATFEFEECDEFVHRHDFLVVAWVPTEEREEVDNSLWKIATFAVARRYVARFRVVPFEWEHRETEAVAIAFAEFAIAIRFEQESKVSELRHCVFPTEEAVEEHVKRCTWQPLFATDDVRHFHQMVVDDVSQVVCWKIVG